MDGPCPSPIEAAERISPTHYRLRTSAGYSGIDRVEIHIVDTIRKIAVFAFCYENNKTCFHALYTPFETGLEMDMVDFLKSISDHLRPNNSERRIPVANANLKSA